MRAIALAVAATVAMSVATASVAVPPFASDWDDTYPSSMLDDNLASAGGSACQICHNSPSGGQPWNAYGWAIRVRTTAGMDILDALLDVEDLDSDDDPGSCSNLEEILGDAHPGFATGPVNTLYFGDGTTVEDQSPPPDIATVRMDLIDPCCPWDLDGDGNVATVDLLGLLAAWGTDPNGPPDFDGDGSVTTVDLLALLAAWGPCP